MTVTMVKKMSYFMHTGVLPTIANNIFSENIKTLCEFFWMGQQHCKWRVKCVKWTAFTTHTNISIDDMVPHKSDRYKRKLRKGIMLEENLKLILTMKLKVKEKNEQIQSFGATNNFLKPFRSLINF